MRDRGLVPGNNLYGFKLFKKASVYFEGNHFPVDVPDLWKRKFSDSPVFAYEKISCLYPGKRLRPLHLYR